MVTADFEGNNYLFCRDKSGRSYWVGNGGPKGGRYPGLNAIAPMNMWPELRLAALEQGVDKEEMAYTPPKPKKKSRPKKAKTTKDTIAIFE